MTPDANFVVGLGHAQPEEQTSQGGTHLEHLVRAPHVHSPDVLEPDLNDLRVPPPLVYPVHDSLRDARLPDFEPLPHPDPDPLQPPQLVPRQRQLRRGRRRRSSIPPAPPPLPPRSGAGLAVGRGPARV